MGPVNVVVIDVANVMGARPDGWWRDRAGAAERLCRAVIALARRGGGEAGAWVLVLEGQAKPAAETLVAEDPTLAADYAPAGDGEVPVPVRLVSAPGSGDDTIVGVVAETTGRDESCLVVTADRGLRARCEELGATVVGPGWLLHQLLPGNIDGNPLIPTSHDVGLLSVTNRLGTSCVCT